MEPEILSKEIIQELIKGDKVARGIASRDEFDYISSVYGPEGVSRVEKVLAEAGSSIKYKEIKPMGFYPLGQEAVILLAIKQAFGFDDQKFEEIGRSSARQSLLLKLLMNFVSLPQAVKAVPKTWGRHYMTGELSVPDWSEEKKFLVLRLVDFKVHPLQCLTLQGYFAQTLQMIIKQPVVGRETRCIFRGDGFHEFLMTWGQPGEGSQPAGKEVVRRLLNTRSETRGIVFKTDSEYVLRKWGRDGLENLEAKLKEMGGEIEYGKIEPMRFYPTGLRVVSLLAIKEVFSLGDEGIREMGSAAPKISLIIKIFAKYFVSINTAVKQVASMWRKHYNAGDLSAPEVDEKAKRIILRLSGLDLDPIFCQYLVGYFATVVRMVVGKPVLSKEIKCSFLGDLYHEFLMTW